MRQTIARMLRAAADRIHAEPRTVEVHCSPPRVPTHAEIAAFVERYNRARGGENMARVLRRR